MQKSILLREPTTALKSDFASKMTFFIFGFFLGLNDILNTPKAEKVKKVKVGEGGDWGVPVNLKGHCYF